MSIHLCTGLSNFMVQQRYHTWPSVLPNVSGDLHFHRDSTGGPNECHEEKGAARRTGAETQRATRYG